MKRTIFFATAIFTLVCATSFAQTPNGGNLLNLEITLSGDGNHNGGAHPLPKTPIQIPEVYLDGNTLSFDAAIEGCTVRLLDLDENVVFTDFIEENQTSLILPSTLTGEFELQIIRGNIIFYCEIEL